MTIALAILLQGAAYLQFQPGQTLTYREEFEVTETIGNKNLTAHGARVQTLRIKEFKNGRAIMDVHFSGMTSQKTSDGADQLTSDLRTWIDREDGEQWVDTRGFLARDAFPSGNRPFFGYNVPAHKDSIPEKWSAKILPAIGIDRTITVNYSIVPNTSDTLAIALKGQGKDKDTSVTLDGTVYFRNGQVTKSNIDTEIVDKDSTVRVLYTAVLAR